MRGADGDSPGVAVPVRLGGYQAPDLRVHQAQAHRQLPALSLPFETAGQEQFHLVPVVLLQSAHSLVSVEQAPRIQERFGDAAAEPFNEAGADQRRGKHIGETVKEL